MSTPMTATKMKEGLSLTGKVGPAIPVGGGGRPRGLKPMLEGMPMIRTGELAAMGEGVDRHVMSTVPEIIPVPNPVTVESQVHPEVLKAIGQCLGYDLWRMQSKIQGMRMMAPGVLSGAGHPLTNLVTEQTEPTAISYLQLQLSAAKDERDSWEGKYKGKRNEVRRLRRQMGTTITEVPVRECDYIISTSDSGYKAGSTGSGATTAFYLNGAEVDAEEGPWALKLCEYESHAVIMYARQARAYHLGVAPPVGRMVRVLKRSSDGEPEELVHGYETRVAAKQPCTEAHIYSLAYERMMVIVYGMFIEGVDFGGCNNGVWKGKPCIVDWGFGCEPLRKAAEYGRDINSELAELEAKHKERAGV